MEQKNSYRRNIKYTYLVSLLLLLLTGCSKYLDKKPTQSQVVPTSLADLQAVLDKPSVFEKGCQFLEMVADNYYITTSSWNNLPDDIRANYVWTQSAPITTNSLGTWGNPYRIIYESNFVLNLLPGIKFSPSEQEDYNRIKGTALFQRGLMFFELAQLFCKPYSEATVKDLGIVIRTIPDVEAIVPRSNIQQTYEQILTDVRMAAGLLPESTLFNTRPAKAAAYGLLSRVYLSMRDYQNAFLNADSALSINNKLIDYNSLISSGNGRLPVNPLNNPEVLFLSSNALAEIFNASQIAMVDSGLYSSYKNNDLRKVIYYTVDGAGTAYWKGSYNSINNYSIFDGIAVDELFLNRAEGRAWMGDINGAMKDLNYLLQMRYATGTFADITATDINDAVKKVRDERRKELAFRGIRWSDLRRYNLEGAGITLQRRVNNTIYTLPPGDLRWVLSIPNDEITQNHVQQNPR